MGESLQHPRTSLQSYGEVPQGTVSRTAFSATQGKEMSTNGKGDRSRVNDIERYRKNFDAIDWDEPDDATTEALQNLAKRLNAHARRYAPNRIMIGKLFSQKPWPDPKTQ